MTVAQSRVTVVEAKAVMRSGWFWVYFIYLFIFSGCILKAVPTRYVDRMHVACQWKSE